MELNHIYISHPITLQKSYDTWVIRTLCTDKGTLIIFYSHPNVRNVSSYSFNSIVMEPIPIYISLPIFLKQSHTRGILPLW